MYIFCDNIYSLPQNKFMRVMLRHNVNMPVESFVPQQIVPLQSNPTSNEEEE
jgi:hypothetical protein